MSSRTVLITGGTSGIGYALAAQFLKRGATVLVTGRTEARLAAVREMLPGVHTFVSDVSDPEAIVRLHEETTRAFPALNVLINNAGIGLIRDLNDSSAGLDDLASEIRSNLIGPVQMIGQFLPHLKAQREAAIVNVSSGLAFVPLPVKPIYCATKAALHSYTQSLRVQLKHTSVKVVELVPPAVRTDFNKGQMSERELNSPMLMDVTKFAIASMRGLERGQEEILPGMARNCACLAASRRTQRSANLPPSAWSPKASGAAAPKPPAQALRPTRAASAPRFRARRRLR